MTQIFSDKIKLQEVVGYFSHIITVLFSTFLALIDINKLLEMRPDINKCGKACYSYFLVNNVFSVSKLNL